MPREDTVADARLQDLKVPAKRFLRLLNYMEMIGFDQRELARSIGLDFDTLNASRPDETFLAIQYSMLYQHAVEHMESMKQPLPWAAGIGTEAFRMMCYCIITCRTLGEALNRAQHYEHLLYPLTRHQIELEQSTSSAQLLYRIDSEHRDDAFSPQGWDRRIYTDSIAKSSGLRVWFAFAGWLTGRTLELQQVSIAGDFVTEAYHESLRRLFNCPIDYAAEKNALLFPLEMLELRIVHTPQSLEEFLQNIPYWLIAMDNVAASTSAAIKSLLGNDFSGGLPSFDRMAAQLHMSTSSLRRRLIKENTSYQQLKDQCRCEVAIDFLCRSDIKIQDIAEQIGFTETSSFVRSFRTWTGVTPKAFREDNSLQSD